MANVMVLKRCLSKDFRPFSHLSLHIDTSPQPHHSSVATCNERRVCAYSTEFDRLAGKRGNLYTIHI